MATTGAAPKRWHVPLPPEVGLSRLRDRCGCSATSRSNHGRGFHLVTREVVGELAELAGIRAGLLHVHIQHTSASLTLNENASVEVRRDFETWLSAEVPESFGGWTHTLEGPDDMPAHIKAALLGPSVTIPVRNGRPHLGTWQGIYLCEHRNHAGPRTLTLTLNGE